MAILKQEDGRKNRIKIEGLVPKGTYIAVILDIEEEYGVTRKKYQSEETETVNLICFYLGGKTKSGELFICRSKRMKISAHEKSALVQFCSSILGSKPGPMFDTESLLGSVCQITIQHADHKGHTYANILGISPVVEGMEKLAPPAKAFAGLLEPKPHPKSWDEANDNIGVPDEDGIL